MGPLPRAEGAAPRADERGGERLGGLLTRAVADAHHAALLPAEARYRRALADPRAAQAARLKRILRDVEGSAYAREHRIRALEDAPVVEHEDLRPWMTRIERGEQGVLTQGPVLMMERSGGSTGPSKLLPFTRALLDEFAAATGPWLRDVGRAFPGVRRGRAYWSVSPVTRAGERTSGGVPIGFEDDTAYFGPVERWALRRLLAVPPEVARFRDVDAWRKETARRLAAARDLALISVWSPTFLLNLLDELEAPPAELWPRLALISCWADGPSAAFLPEIRARLPGVLVQGKGLLATEGVVTIPYRGGPVLAVASHVYEFLDVDRPDAPPLKPWDLRVGGRYSPLLTTGAGLVRYHLNDIISCTGFEAATPRLRFEGRLDHVADLCGEKVSLGQAEAALARAFEKVGDRPRFALLAPMLRPKPHYVLFAESDAPHLDAAALVVDEALAAAHPYRHCRELGQLGPVRLVRVRDGRRAYERHLAAGGARVGALKPALLDPLPRWEGVFE